MARKVQVILSDDLDENLSADETVSFSLDGTSYEIDLADKNAKEMREVFSRYVSAARKVGRGARASGGGRSRATGGRMDREQAGAIRDWARKNGHAVSDRGRHMPRNQVASRWSSHFKIARLVSAGLSCWIQWPQSRLTTSTLGTNSASVSDLMTTSRSP